MGTVPDTITGDTAIRAVCLNAAVATVASGHAGPDAGSVTATQIAEQYRGYVQNGQVAQ